MIYIFLNQEKLKKYLVKMKKIMERNFQQQTTVKKW